MNKNAANIASATMPFPSGFDVCWAGPNPFNDGFCVGSEDGLVQFFDKNFTPVGEPFKASASGEAVNSVVRRDMACRVNSPGDQFHWQGIPEWKSTAIPDAIRRDHLGVTPSGYFVATLGRAGLFFARADLTKEDFIITNPGSEGELSAYRLLTLGGNAGDDLIVCAGRTGGIAYGQWNAAQPTMNMRTMSFAGLDVVDICSIGTIENPRAVAALGRDGSVVLAKDIVNDEQPGTLKFVSVTGTAFRIVSCRGHLFVLTRESLYGLWNLAENFVNGTLAVSGETQILALPMEAIDINLVMDHWMLIVGLDSIVQVDVDAIQENNTEGGMEKDQPRILAPDWKRRGVSQTAKEFALTA